MAVAAYASVLYLLHSLDNVLLPSRRWVIPDMSQIQALRQKLGFLQEFLELHSTSNGAVLHDLVVKVQIRQVVEEADGVIDRYVLDRLRITAAGSSSDESLSSSFYHDLQVLIQKIESINQELSTMVNEGHGKATETSPGNSSSSTFDSTGNNTMVGFEDHLVKIMDRLTRNERSLQTISIVGMGGIGKTTLAHNIFDNKLTTEHFDERIWITISQKYDVHKILLDLLRDKKIGEGASDMVGLGTRLYQKLLGLRYLIVMDDVWSSNVWDDFKMLFPNNGKGSRIIMTTRLIDVAVSLGGPNTYQMSFLDEETSWRLLSEKAFCNGGWSAELEEIGKKIAGNCGGLPLTLVVIGGLLAKSDLTREYWEYVANDMNSFCNSEIDENCLRILSLSYNHLPIHLKLCFLSMQNVSFDFSIGVSTLIEMWVAEGFVKPTRDKTLEEVAMEYLKDLISRNMVFIRKWGSRGNIKECCTHDLLRQLCIKESYIEDLDHIFRIPKGQQTNRHSSFSKDSCLLCSETSAETKIQLCELLLDPLSTALLTPVVCHDCNTKYLRLSELRFIWYKVDSQMVGIPLTTKCCWLSIATHIDLETTLISSSAYMIFALRSLQVSCYGERQQIEMIMLLSGIWEMPQLRSLRLRGHMLPCPVVTEDIIVLQHLQTLSKVRNLKLTEEVVRRVPNLRRLSLYYNHDDELEAAQESSSSRYCLNNLALLHKLQSLTLCFDGITSNIESIAFPSSLEKLNLVGCRLHWEDMTMIGSLPNLQVLKLYNKAIVGEEWCSIEGQFMQLKYLKIADLDLVTWRVESSHFPALEKLILSGLKELEECPLDIGEIDTLQKILVAYCNTSTAISVIQLFREQVNDYGNEVLDINIAHELNKDEGLDIDIFRELELNDDYE